MRKRWEPAGSAAGSHLASEVGGRLPGSKNRTGRLRGQTVVLLCPGTLPRLVVQADCPCLRRGCPSHAPLPQSRLAICARQGVARARNTWTRHPRLTIWYGWCRSDGSPFSSARLARARCSRSGSGSRSLSRLLVSARVRPWVRSRVRARGPLSRPHQARQNTRQRPGKTPQTARSLGSERGLATPSPDGKGEIPLGPSVKIMPVDSYSTLGRSCEPAFKWIRQARPRLGPRSAQA